MRQQEKQEPEDKKAYIHLPSRERAWDPRNSHPTSIHTTFTSQPLVKMRTTTLLCSLYLTAAPLALSAPIPIILLDDIEALAKRHTVEPPRLGQHPPAPIGTRPGQLRPEQWTASGKYPSSSNQIAIGGTLNGGGAAATPFDNRPVPLPPSRFPASAVLSSPAPISTADLLALAAAKAGGERKDATLKVAATQDEPAKEEAAGWDLDAMITQMQESRGQLPTSLRTSCQLTTLVSREYSDVLVIGLVVSFFLVIVLVETWEASCKRSVMFFSSHVGCSISGTVIADLRIVHDVC